MKLKFKNGEVFLWKDIAYMRLKAIDPGEYADTFQAAALEDGQIACIKFSDVVELVDGCFVERGAESVDGAR